MSYKVDGADQGADPHINFEPTNFKGLQEQERTAPPPRPFVQGEIGRQRIERTANFKQAGERWRAFSDEERNELVMNLVGALSECEPVIREKMVSHFTQADPEYGRRVAEGLGMAAPSKQAAE
jgi:catalase